MDLRKEETNARKKKKIYPCKKCKQLRYCAAQCPQKQQHAADRRGKSAIKKDVDAFVEYVMEASTVNIVDADSC